MVDLSPHNHHHRYHQHYTEANQEEQSTKQFNRPRFVFLLSSCYLVSAAVIILLTRSLSLLSEAGHMVADLGGLALSLFAITYAKKPPTPERTYGFLEWRF